VINVQNRLVFFGVAMVLASSLSISAGCVIASISHLAGLGFTGTMLLFCNASFAAFGSLFAVIQLAADLFFVKE
jgi:hypothetical protein